MDEILEMFESMGVDVKAIKENQKNNKPFEFNGMSYEEIFGKEPKYDPYEEHRKYYESTRL